MEIMVYTTKEGFKIEHNIEEDVRQAFKVNLPLTDEDYFFGNGEGVWGCTSQYYLAKLDKNEKCILPVMVLNDSYYYPNLKYGMIVLCMYDGKNRPVAVKSELDYQFGQCITELEKESLLRKVERMRQNRYEQ